MRDLTVLVTASGAPGTAALLHALRENGERRVRLVGTDMSARSVGRHLCDAFHLVPPGSDAGFGHGAGRGATAAAAEPESGEQTAFWRPDEPAAPILRFDDGMVVTVDEDLVLGRRPDNHEMVTSGSARPVPIADTQNVLSSAHAALTRSGREVSLVDLGSLNGTHVAGPEATEWTQLEPGVAHPLSDGDRLLLGWTVITFEQPQD